MEEFWILFFVLAFAINSLDKTESVQLEETSLKIIDEIFGEGWWDNDKADEWDKLTLEHNVLNENIAEDEEKRKIIDKFHEMKDELKQKGKYSAKEWAQTGQIEEPYSTDQLGQIEPNSTDQLGQIVPNSTDQLGQIVPNSTDQLGQIEPQNPPLTESDHSDNAKNVEGQNEIIKDENIAEDARKRKIIDKFHAMKDEFKQKRKYSKKERTQIEEKIAKHLKVTRTKIYKWKKEFGLSRKKFYEKEERKHLVEKFDQMKAELKRDGLKNSYKQEIDENVAKELGLSFVTIYNWKRELGQSRPNHKYTHNEQKELMKCYYEIKDQYPKICDKDIVKILEIGTSTLVNWKMQFTRQQFCPNSVESVEENSGSDVPEIGKSNSGI